MPTRLLVAATLGWSCEGKDDTAGVGDGSDADTDVDTDTDTDTDSDTDTDTFFLHAEGTYDGSAFELDCPPGLLTGLWVSEAEFVLAVCDENVHGKDPGHTVALLAIDPAIGDDTKCSSASDILVGVGKKEAYDCLSGGVTSYDLDTREVTASAKSTIWGGTFAMIGDDGTHSADISGSFRVDCLPGGGDGGGGE